MAAIMPAATHISPDEKAEYLVELNLADQVRKGIRRTQIVYVYRDDRLAEWRKDLGPANAFKAGEFRIPSLGEHTVGELWDIAEHARLGDDYWQKRTQELAGESSLITDWLNQIEERQNIIQNRTVSGPLVTKQRNGFDLRRALATGRNR